VEAEKARVVSELSASLLSISALEEQRASLEAQRGVLEGERDGLSEMTKAQAEALQQARIH
jgi:hypothetical protein